MRLLVRFRQAIDGNIEVGKSGGEVEKGRSKVKRVRSGANNSRKAIAYLPLFFGIILLEMFLAKQFYTPQPKESAIETNYVVYDSAERAIEMENSIREGATLGVAAYVTGLIADALAGDVVDVAKTITEDQTQGWPNLKSIIKEGIYLTVATDNFAHGSPGRPTTCMCAPDDPLLLKTMVKESAKTNNLVTPNSYPFSRMCLDKMEITVLNENFLDGQGDPSLSNSFALIQVNLKNNGWTFGCLSEYRGKASFEEVPSPILLSINLSGFIPPATLDWTTLKNKAEEVFK